MANTLNLGTNGNWAVKDGSLLGYNNENNNIKPLPFDFTRASSATRVNKQGLIETVASGVPRIDFTDANGALLLEPQRTNAVTNSETFGSTGWQLANTGTGSSVVTNNYAISPDGTQNAQRIQFSIVGSTGAGDRTFIRQSISSQTNWFLSVYMKSTNGTDQKVLWHTGGDGNETTVTGEWKRYTYNVNGTTNSKVGLAMRGGVSTVESADILVYGFQAEQGSYATSYIPTQGSAVTRTLETSNISNLDDFVLPNTSWTAVGEFIKGQDTDSSLYIVFAYYLASSNLFRIRDYTSYVRYTVFEPSELHFTSGTPLGSTVKWAFRAKADGSYSVYVGGVSIGETSGTFRALDLYNMVGNAKTDTKGLKLYNTALTDAELIALTTI
jgi:hypothetical protein